MDEKTLLLYFLTKVFSKTEDEIIPLLYEGEVLKDDAGDALLALNASKVAAFKAERDSNFDKGHEKAKREVLSKAEKALQEKLGYKGAATTFDEMLDEIAKTGKKTTLTDDDIKKHPLYLELEAKRIPKEDHERVLSEFEQFKSQQSKHQLMSQIKSRAWDIVEPKKPILSENASVAKTRREDFLSKLDAFDYEQNGSDWIVVKEGKRVEDAHGNPKTLTSLVDDLAGMSFDFPKQDAKGSPGTPAGQNPYGKMNETQYYEKLKSEQDPQKRIEIQAAYRNQ